MRVRLNTALGVLSVVMMLAALYAALIYAPAEVEQGDVQRIFYFHLPCAWVAFLAYGIVAICGVMYLWMGHQVWDDIGYASAEAGTLFCTLTLATGSIWAKPIWGVWWTWDARLTTTFVLWLMYVGYLLLRVVAEESEQTARFAAVIGIVGVLDVPVVIVSVRLWRTIHPAVLLTRQGSHGLENPAMIAALLLSIAAFTVTFGWMLMLRTVTLRVRSRALALRRELVMLMAVSGDAA